MRIGFFVHSYPPAYGGIERLSNGFAHLAREDGHEVIVFTIGPTLSSETCDGIEIRRFPTAKKRIPGPPYNFSPELERSAGRANLDVLHGFEYRNHPIVVAAKLARTRGLPLIWSTAFHPAHRSEDATFLRGVYDFTQGRMVAGAANVVAYLTQAELAILVKHHKVVSRRASMKLPPYFDLSAYARMTPEANTFRRSHGIDEEFILFIGRLEQYKGAGLLIDALAHAKIPRACVIIGPDPGGEAIGLARRAAKLGQQLHILGPLSEEEKLGALSAASLYVNLSNYESFGITVAEAALVGAPILTTPHGFAGDLPLDPRQIVLDLRPDNLGEQIEDVIRSGIARDSIARIRRYAESELNGETIRVRLREAYSIARGK